MRFHMGMLCTCRVECLFNNYICACEALLCIAMPNTKMMTNICALLGAYTKIGRIIIRDRVMLMDKGRALGNRLYSVEDAWELFILHIDQTQSLLSFAPCRCSNCHDRITCETNAIYGKHGLILDLATVMAKIANIVWCKHNNVIGYSRGIYPHNTRMGIGRAQDTSIQHLLKFNILRITDSPADSWITHGIISSRARRTSTAMIRRRYSAEPRESDIG